MPFSEIRDGKSFYRCGRCGMEFQYGPKIYEGYCENGEIYCKGCGKPSHVGAGASGFNPRTLGIYQTDDN